MSIYRYGKDSIVDEITFEKSDGGSIRAYLHADKNADNAKLMDISKALSGRGWQNIPAAIDSKPTLEIRGFGSEKKLLKELEKKGWIKGDHQIERTLEKPISFANKIKQNSLKASGLSFLVGDAAYAAYGYKKGHLEDILAGAMYFAGSATLLGYGNQDNAQMEIHDLAKKMQDEVKKQSFNLPENCSLAAITSDHKKGVLKTTDDLLSRYPSEIMNAFFGLAGVSIIASALRHNIYAKPPEGWDKEQVHRKVREGKMDVALGATTMSSGALASLIQEKSLDPDAPKKHGVAALWEQIQEHPLAVAGIGYIVSTCFHAAGSYHSMKSAVINHDETMKKSIPLRITFVGANLIAEILMTISSKGHGKGVISDKSVDDSVIALTADLIAKQPENMQKNLIDYMSGFLGREDVLAMKDSNVRDRLQEQVELMRNNPWAQCMTLAADSKDKRDEKTPTSKGSNKANWQSAIKTINPESQSPSFI